MRVLTNYKGDAGLLFDTVVNCKRGSFRFTVYCAGDPNRIHPDALSVSMRCAAAGDMEVVHIVLDENDGDEDVIEGGVLSGLGCDIPIQLKLRCLCTFREDGCMFRAVPSVNRSRMHGHLNIVAGSHYVRPNLDFVQYFIKSPNSTRELSVYNAEDLGQLIEDLNILAGLSGKTHSI